MKAGFKSFLQTKQEVGQYTNSLANATFGSVKKIMLNGFCVKQVKWHQLIQHEQSMCL